MNGLIHKISVKTISKNWNDLQIALIGYQCIIRPIPIVQAIAIPSHRDGR